MRFLSTPTGSFAMPAAETPTVAMVEAAYPDPVVMRRALEAALKLR